MTAQLVNLQKPLKRLGRKGRHGGSRPERPRDSIKDGLLHILLRALEQLQRTHRRFINNVDIKLSYI